MPAATSMHSWPAPLIWKKMRFCRLSSDFTIVDAPGCLHDPEGVDELIGFQIPAIYSWQQVRVL